jgi:hypothetical protein
MNRATVLVHAFRLLTVQAKSKAMLKQLRCAVFSMPLRFCSIHKLGVTMQAHFVLYTARAAHTHTHTFFHLKDRHPPWAKAFSVRFFLHTQ